MKRRLTILDFINDQIPEDHRFFLDLKFFGIPSIVNNTLRFIKNKWPQCEGVSIAINPNFPIDDDIEDEQFKLEKFPLYDLQTTSSGKE